MIQRKSEKLSVMNLLKCLTKRLENCQMLTFSYSDVIESGTAIGKGVKSHHNVGGLPEDLQFTLIEPIRALFKDEVRKVGLALGMPENIIWRQPFPGPGLGIRVLGEVTREKLTI